MRGLDYYTHTVFEWITTKLGSQDAVCSGGRYDHLVEQLGGKSVPAVGFALGLERLINLINQTHPIPEEIPDIYIIAEEACLKPALLIAENLRDALPHLQVISDNSGASLKSQFKKADRSGAEYALILGEKEIAQQTISVKTLREEAEQENMTFLEVIEFFENKI